MCSSAGTVTSFHRAETHLSFFLTWLDAAQSGKSSDNNRFYLAQASLSGFPQALQNDLPTPDIVIGAGKGDIYDTNIWMGLSPTYTPLHRDPNPNLFVQLAGEKIVRLMSPEKGTAIFKAVQRKLGKGGDGRFRGEEMMKGGEGEILKRLVWGNEADQDGVEHGWKEGDKVGWEGFLGRGDGLFIPKGWWHSVKGVGDGVLASVSSTRWAILGLGLRVGVRSTGGFDEQSAVRRTPKRLTQWHAKGEERV